MTPKELRNERLAQTLIKNLKRRHIEGFYCPTGDDAVKKVSWTQRVCPAVSFRGVRLHFLPVSEGGSPTLYQDITYEKVKNWKIRDT